MSILTQCVSAKQVDVSHIEAPAAHSYEVQLRSFKLPYHQGNAHGDV